MPSVSLNFPILVQNIKVDDKPQYYLRPLFIGNPVSLHRRYERAVTKLQSEIRRQFKGFVINRENAHELLWYRFNPNVQYKTYKMEFVVSKQYISGTFGMAYFVLKDLCFVTLPAFNNYMFIAEKNEKGKVDLFPQALEVIQGYFRSMKKQNKDAIDIQPFTARKGEFLTQLRFNVRIENGKFPFSEDQLGWFFSSISNNTDFNGGVEIEKVGHDLNEHYPGELKRAFYREDLLKRLNQIIYQQENTPIVLVGPVGVGKKSLIEELVWRHMDANKSDGNEYKVEKIWQVDPTRIIAGMSIVGMWQKRFESIIQFIIERRKKWSHSTDKMLIDNVVAMLRIGKSAQNDMTLNDVLKPYLERRTFQLILVASPEEWKIIQEKDRRFADLFQLIRIGEPLLEDSVKMVVEQRKILEMEYNCGISAMAIMQLFTIHRNYLKRNALPGSVMKLLHQLAVKYKGLNIDAEEVRKEFQDYSGLHQEIFDASYTFEENAVSENINSQLIGQEEAGQCLADVIHMIKSKLNNPDKPLGTFLFIGPTGVGKTQAAKVLCNYLMGNEDQLLRFDMNEYIDEYSIQRLIGDYYNPEGQLTGKVRYCPFGIILFDEIEKAHPKVHDLLLQVLDDGRLTDSLGRTVDFTNTIIIMTSNVGAREASIRLGFEVEGRDESAIYRKAVEQRFRPEFINRIDRIVIFNPLQLNHILKIARLQIKELLSRDGFVRRTTILNISSDALEWVAKRGFDARMGGRALKRQIERDLTSLSADQLNRTYSDKPIIFNIYLKDGRLFPDINVLEFVDPIGQKWMPEIPSEKKLRGAYKNMMRSIDGLRNIVDRMEENGNSSEADRVDIGQPEDLDYHYYDFKDRIVELKEHIEQTYLGFGNNHYTTKATKPFRLKRAGTSSIIYQREETEGKVQRKVQQDKLFQKEVMEELNEIYSLASSQFDKHDSQYLNDYLDVVFLHLFSIGFRKGLSDEIEIKLNSCITNLGQEEMDFLLEHYEALLKELGINYKIYRKSRRIVAEGHSLNILFNGEDGIHLFNQSHQNPLPIRVEVGLLNVEANLNKKPLKVIRLYSGIRTLTDLRTGFSNAGNITANEFKFLLFGGLNTQYLQQFSKL